MSATENLDVPVDGNSPVVAINWLGQERRAAGIATPHELAVRAEIDPVLYEVMEQGRLLPSRPELERLCAVLAAPPDRLYRIDVLQILGVAPGYGGKSANTPAKVMQSVRGAERLFVARNEVTWSYQREIPDEPVDFFLSMSCGTLATPHLLLDTVACAKALGLKFVAAAGPAGCCGKPYLGLGQYAAGEAFTHSKVTYAQAIGAKTTVVWCTADQQTALNQAAHRRFRGGIEHPIREIQALRFLEEQIRQLGDRVPWKHEVPRRVIAEGHSHWSNVHTAASEAEVRLLRLIPGVEVVAKYDGSDDELSPCAGRSRPAWRGPWRPDRTAEEVQTRREGLANMAASLGADTVACMHLGCHQTWARYASERLAVRHAVSILAEALGCANPDREQAAAQLGDPAAVVAQTRPIWQTWGMSEEEAFELARRQIDSIYASAVTGDECGIAQDGGNADLISIDVLLGRSPGLSAI
jgi:Fe-S oxidoreductase